MSGETALFPATFNGHLEVFKHLLEKSGTLTSNEDGYTCFHTAASYGRIYILHHILDQDKLSIDVQANDGATPLYCAASQGQWIAVFDLLNRGADISLSYLGGDTVVHLAAAEGHVVLARELLDKDPRLIDAQARLSQLQNDFNKTAHKEFANQLIKSFIISIH